MRISRRYGSHHITSRHATPRRAAARHGSRRERVVGWHRKGARHHDNSPHRGPNIRLTRLTDCPRYRVQKDLVLRAQRARAAVPEPKVHAGPGPLVRGARVVGASGKSSDRCETCIRGHAEKKGEKNRKKKRQRGGRGGREAPDKPPTRGSQRQLAVLRVKYAGYKEPSLFKACAKRRCVFERQRWTMCAIKMMFSSGSLGRCVLVKMFASGSVGRCVLKRRRFQAPALEAYAINKDAVFKPPRWKRVLERCRFQAATLEAVY